MITELLDAIVSWRTLLVALVVFGFAPGALLRLIVLAFRRDDPRRSELLAELHAVPRLERPFWVFEQLEVALFEGIHGRVSWAQAKWFFQRKRRSTFFLRLSEDQTTADQMVHVDYSGRLREEMLAVNALFEPYARIHGIEITSADGNRYVARIRTHDGNYRLAGAGREFWKLLQKLDEQFHSEFKVDSD